MAKRQRFYTQNIIFKSGLSVHAIAVYCYLSYRANRQGTCYPSRETIVRDCTISVRTVDKAISELQAADMLTITAQYRHTSKGNRRQISNLYQLIDKQPGEVQPPHPDGESSAPTSAQAQQGEGAGCAEEINTESNLKESHKERRSFNHSAVTMDDRLQAILENMELERLTDRRLAETLESVVFQMYHQPSISVNDLLIPQQFVRNQLERLDYECVELLIGSMKYSNTINRGSNYLMACLYNVVNDLDVSITAALV